MKTYDIEEGEQRLLNRQAEHPQRGSKNLKQEELKAHSQRMGEFMAVCKQRRGLDTKIFTEPDELVQAIDDYLAVIQKIQLFPTLQGLALFCDIDVTTLYAVENLGDNCSKVLQKFRMFISEYFNQSGLASNTNPIFSIYYGKSVLGQSDQGPLTVNLNVNDSRKLDAAEVLDAIELTPDDWEEVK